MVKYLIILFLLVLNFSCSSQKTMTSGDSELPYENYKEGIDTVVGIDNFFLYEEKTIEVIDLEGESEKYLEIDLKNLITYELITGVKFLDDSFQTESELITEFISTSKAYYIGSINKNSDLILVDESNELDYIQMVYLVNHKKGKIKSICLTAFLFDFQDLSSKASTTILGNNQFKYITEEIFSDVVTIDEVDNDKFDILFFSIDNKGLIKLQN